jgi:hypothetical protein
VAWIKSEKGIQNLLKMDLENRFGKRKGISFPSPSLPSISASWPFLTRAPSSYR